MDFIGRLKVCTSVYASSIDLLETRISDALSWGSDLVEIRTDYLAKIDEAKLKRVIGINIDKCVMTCRPSNERGQFRGNETIRRQWLMRMAEMQPAFLDIELETAIDIPEHLSKLPIRDKGLIISWHNLDETPSISNLQMIMEKAGLLGSHVKIVTRANSLADNLKILSLYKNFEQGKLIAFCMGEKGMLSRVLCPLAGSPFTYASLKGMGVAEGQIPINELRRIYDSIQVDS